MTAVNGVFLGTANHPAGARQLLRFRSGATDEMPLALDLLGAERDGAALPSVSLGGAAGFAFQSNVIDPTVLSALDHTAPEDLRRMARVMRTRARAIEGVGDRATTASIEATAQFFERIAEAPHFEVKPNPEGTPPSAFVRDLARTKWLLENDLARGVVLGAANWDTHAYNTRNQQQVTQRHFPAIRDFLTSLETATNKHGSLFDNTLVVLASEVGRHPVLNHMHGKDHFPEAPFLFVNAPGGGGQVFGRTGKRMEALPFAKRRSGKVTLTDVGISILRIGGVDPNALGYVGEPLEFLEA
jgi:uncharacterized protein (DUF1501 family)